MHEPLPAEEPYGLAAQVRFRGGPGGASARGYPTAAYKLAEDMKLPLATGPTEAAAKSLVGVRMKRSGARYSQHGGQTILTLLAAHKSRRFDALWEVIVANCYAANVTRRVSLAS